MGLNALLALSDGTLIENPRWLKHSLAKLRVATKKDHEALIAVTSQTNTKSARLHDKIKQQPKNFGIG